MLGSIPSFLRQRDLIWGSIPIVCFVLWGISPFSFVFKERDWGSYYIGPHLSICALRDQSFWVKGLNMEINPHSLFCALGD